uniref:Uncharacterized protein n=1 Tax=viral metagenome TaxID=1070528 RepID=A0A6M3ISJ5_9ZZZZ
MTKLTLADLKRYRADYPNGPRKQRATLASGLAQGVLTLAANKVEEKKTMTTTAQTEMAVETLVETVKAMQEANQGRPIHVVYSGLNQALRNKGFDPRASVAAAVEIGKLYGRGARGGYMVSTTPFRASPNARVEAASLALQRAIDASRK